MCLKKSINIIKIILRFRFKRYKLFRIDSILSVISNLMWLLASILFWFLITETGFQVNGWTYREILVFIAFSEMFYGFEQNIFSVATDFWVIVYSGSLDGQLTRPFDPRARFMLLNMDFLGLILSFIKVGVIFAVSRIHLSAWKIAAGVLVILVANYVLMLIRFMASYLSFRLGKMDAIRQLCDCVTKFNKYPLVIFPKILRIIMMTIVPFYFFSTFSAQFVLDKLDHASIFWMLLALAGNVVIWSLLNNIAWKRGRMRYESLNG